MAAKSARSGIHRFVLAATLAGTSTLGWAQQPPSAPTRPEVTPPPPERTVPPPRVRIDDSRAMPQPACPLLDSDVVVEISQVRFTPLNGGELHPGIRDALSGIGPGTTGPQSVAVVCEIRDQANAALRRAGYVATVQIPPQTISSGELQLNVITARIVEVRIRGDAPPYRDTIAARAEQLKALDPLNERDAERILLLAGDIPGLDVQMALLPAGTNPGDVIGELNLIYRPYSVLFNANNFGSRQLGREIGYLRAELYGLTGASDVTYAGVSTTADFDEQRVVQIGHITGLGSSGVGLEGSFLYAWSRPDIGLLDLRSESLIAALAVSAPLRRSRRQDFGIVGGLELIEQRTRIFANDVGQPLNRDKLRVAFLRLEGEFRDYLASGEEAYVLASSLEIRKGLDIFGATETGSISPEGFTPSRFSGDATALVIRASVDGLVRVGPFALVGQARAQWADNPLLNFEEYSIGNLTIGRGYDPGSNSADRAVGLRGELRATFWQSSSVSLDVLGFYDSVWIWNLDPNAIETDRRLGSWGLGVRALLPGRAVIEAIYARPEDVALLVPGARRAPERLLLSLTLQFPPGGR